MLASNKKKNTHVQASWQKWFVVEFTALHDTGFSLIRIQPADE